MFFTLILQNENGEQIDMTATANRYMTSKISGLHPPPGTVSTSSYAGMNGRYLNNASSKSETSSSALKGTRNSCNTCRNYRGTC